MGSVTLIPGLGVMLVWTPTPSLPSADPSHKLFRLWEEGTQWSLMFAWAPVPATLCPPQSAVFIKHWHFNSV